MSKTEFRLENAYQYNRNSPIRWILSHLFRYPWLPIGVTAAAIINNLAASAMPVYVGKSFDLVMGDEWKTAVLLSFAFYTFGASSLQSIFGLARNYSNEMIAQRIERDTRDELYSSLLGKSQTFHGKQRIGDIMARATNDVRTLNIMFSPGFMLLLDSFISLVVPITFIGLIDSRLLLVPFLFVITFSIAIRDYARQLNPVSGAMREQFGKMNAGLAESVGGIEVVKGNAQEAQEIRKFVTDAALFRDYFVKQGLIQAQYLPLLILSFALGGGFFHAMVLWKAGSISLGQLISFMGLMGILRFPTFISIFSFNLVQLGIASAKRILEMINNETNLDENETGIDQPIAGDVTFEEVSFGYDGGTVLDGVSFTAVAGQTVAIVGETGAGKTTMTRLINRIFDAENGRVLIDNINVRDWNLESLRSQISTIEQDIFLFSRTIAENIAFGQPDATQEAIVQAAKEAQAHDFILSFKEGYATEIGERGATLSGGQKQRLAIARAFLTNPRILILDDSASAIDSATEDKIQHAMRRISSQRTTFLITHRLSQIRWADKILVLRQGSLVDQGTHEELMKRSKAYQRIFARYD